jgi:hypothetical protein
MQNSTFNFSFLKPWRIALPVIAVVLLSMSTLWPQTVVGGGTGWCSDYEGNNFPCSDDSGSGGGGDYYGGGYGGGCAGAAYDDTYYDTGSTNYELSVGDYHSDYANVVWDGEYWQAADGYHYVTDEPDDYRVARNIGSYHSEYPNVVWDGDYWTAADGYQYVSDDVNDFRVERVYGSSHPDYPNISWNGSSWDPADGYYWSSDDPDDLNVFYRSIGSEHPDYSNTSWNGDSWEPADGYVWASNDTDSFSTALRVVGVAHPLYPNTQWNGEEWETEKGYIWVSEDPDDLRTTLRPVGAAHADYPNTFWNGDTWDPAAGYVWASDDPADLSVIPESQSEPVQEAALVDTETLSSGPSLSINDVPSPSGYKTEAERRERLAKLSDEQIDRELARIRKMLVKMQADFVDDTGDLKDWLKEAQTAEDDALKDSFGLLVGGSLDKYADTWAKFPRLKAIASDGLDYAGKLDQLIKMGSNPMDIAHHRELVRDKMIEFHKELVESGVETVSEQGTKVVSLIKFGFDYSYHMTRWGLALNQIHAISDNLDKPNGKLQAQLAIKELQEDLFAEKGRRIVNAQ